MRDVNAKLENLEKEYRQKEIFRERLETLYQYNNIYDIEVD